ncbi:hypothetical protein M9979_10600 [Sphingomonas sp. RP10(2022)]|uniref:Antifreeze glycopeptide polyprotein n=1 Tax=Sphingomonas liriopis TaxID=2949094 RepID=A0A9X2HXN3_9SPHN|nr:hypothetical protein [Sphingomonas liriopis]MCP3735319.1 hypothetical protein [Sphingomonas liriopis]
MPTSARARLLSLARGGAVLTIAVAALNAYGAANGQERPESILPPGFGEPAAQPTARATTSAPRPAATGAAPAPAATGFVQPLPTDTPTPTASATPTATPTVDPDVLAQYEMPEFARRSLDRIGPAGPREGALGPEAFRGADGGFVEGLMRRVAAPLPSRWLSILLRRTLVAQLDTPEKLNGADFAAERAWLLLRMGEAVAARAVVQSVDNADYTPKLYQVAMNAALATGDPAELCGIADAGLAATRERGWTLAQAMCAGLAAEPARAKALLTAARRRNVASGIDLQLAQKVVGAAPGGGQAVTIEWAGVGDLTAWRFGLAAATGVTIPDELFDATGRQARYWYALAPGIPLADRIGAADAAAGQGVLSAAALVDLYSAVDAANDMPAAASGTANDLRTAYVGNDVDARLAAMRQLWGVADKAGGEPPYARLVLTARAAARLPVRTGIEEAPLLVASMLTAGIDRGAARWRGAVDEGSDAWAMIALADPDAGGRLSYRQLSSYAGRGDAALKQRLFFAGLAGLGRLAPDDIERAAEALDVRIGAQNAWTRAIDRAAAEGQQGNVVLLAAIGMQTPAWRGVPPAMLYRIVGALRAVGLEGEARMIAAEALARV